MPYQISPKAQALAHSIGCELKIAMNNDQYIKQAHSNIYSSEETNEWMHNNKLEAVVLVHGEVVLGHIEYDTEKGSLTTIVIPPIYRDLGLSTVLFCQLADDLSEYVDIKLICEAELQQIYEQKLGFEKNLNPPPLMDNGYVPMLAYKENLSAAIAKKIVSFESKQDMTARDVVNRIILSRMKRCLPFLGVPVHGASVARRQQFSPATWLHEFQNERNACFPGMTKTSQELVQAVKQLIRIIGTFNECKTDEDFINIDLNELLTTLSAIEQGADSWCSAHEKSQRKPHVQSLKNRTTPWIDAIKEAIDCKQSLAEPEPKTWARPRNK